MNKIANLLIFIMTFMLAAANVSAASFADVEGKNCATAVEVLSALGIVEGNEKGEYAPDASLTRAEMATILLRTMNLASGAEGKNIFSDVPSSHWAYANISAAYSMGIVNGMGADTFAPDDAVTREQAVKMVVSALGYGVQAETEGGYPSGYLAKASQLGILKGLQADSGFNRGDMAILLYNALDTELFLRTSYGDDVYTFASDASKTLLSYYLKVTKITDKLTATPMARFAGDTRRLLSDEVATDNLVMKKGETDAQALLGIPCDMYVREEDGSAVPELLAIIPKTRVQVTEVNAQDIDASTNTNIFRYTDAAGKEQKVSIQNAKLLYNGREENKAAELLTPETGCIRLISENGSDADLIIVEAYQNYIVDSVNSETYRVYFKDGSNILLDMADNSFPTTLTSETGFPLTVADLGEWDVLSIAESLPAQTSRVRKIYRSNQSVEGVVREISDKEVTIDTAVYPYHIVHGTLTLGEDAVYYLDYTGTVAAVDTNRSAGRMYGWLAGAAYTKGLDSMPQIKIFTQDGEMRVYDTAEKVTLNDTVVQNTHLLDEKPEEAELWADGSLCVLYKNGAVVPQLIVYKTNEDGQIIKIDTATNRTSPSAFMDEEKIGGDFSMDWYYNDQRYGTGFNGTREGNGDFTTKDGGFSTKRDQENMRGIYFGKVITNENTKLFVIPPVGSKDTEYAIRPLAQFGWEPTRESQCVSFYDVSEAYVCGAMVMHNYLSGQSTLTYPSHSSVTPALVTGVSKIASEDGEIYTAVKLYNANGQEVTVRAADDFRFLFRTANVDLASDPDWYIEKNDGTISRELSDVTNRTDIAMFLDLDDLQAGDVIQYSTDAAGTLVNGLVVHRGRYPGTMEMSIGNGGKLTTTFYEQNYFGGVLSLSGTVFAKSGSLPLVKTFMPERTNANTATKGFKSTTELVRALPVEGKFVLWDRNKETMRAISAVDIMIDDGIYAYWVTNTQRLVVVYR